MAITPGTRAFDDLNATTTHTLAVTIALNAKIVVFALFENAVTSPVLSLVQFDGNTMTQIGTMTTLDDVDIAAYYYDSALSAAAYNFTFTSSESVPSKLTAYPMSGDYATGAPEANISDTETTDGIVGDASQITVSAGAFLMGAVSNSGDETFTVSSDVTEGDDDNSNFFSGGNAADLQASGGAKDVIFTYASSTKDIVMKAVSVAVAAGGATPKGPLGHPLSGPLGF